MMTENAIVTKTNPSVAWVKTIRVSACKGCSAREGCGTQGSPEEMIVKVQNILDVKKGDHVVIGLETRPMLYLTFLLYVFPIILLLIGAMIGNSLAPALQMDPSFAAMISGFSFFALAFFIIRKKNDSLSEQKKYKPFLVRKKPHTISGSCSTP